MPTTAELIKQAEEEEKKKDTTSDLISQIEASQNSDTGGSAERFGAEETTMGEAVFPRTSAYSKQLESGDAKPSAAKSLSKPILDVLSVVGRGAAAIPALAPGGETFKESLARTKGKAGREGLGKLASFAGDVIRDPATAATAPFAGGLLKEPLKSPVRTGIKEGAKRLSTLAGKGAIESAPSAAVHQLETISETGRPNIGEFAGELALGTGVQLGGRLTKNVINKALSLPKETADKIMASYLKAPIKIYDDGFKPANIAKHNLFGTTEEIVAMANNKLSAATKELDDMISRATKGTGKDINIAQALSDAADNIIDNKLELKNAEIFFPDEAGTTVLSKNINKMAGLISELTDGKDAVSIQTANKIKQKIGNLGLWSHGTKEADLSAVEALANRMYINLKTAIEKQLPENAKALNKAMNEIIPIKRAAVRRLPIDQRNDILGLSDVTAFTNAFGSSEVEGGVAGAALGLVNRALKNPTTAEASSLIGKGTEPLKKPLQKLSRGAGLPLRQSARTAVYGKEEEEKQNQPYRLPGYRY